MRYLRKYKLFESNSDDCINTIKDILLELQLIDYQSNYIDELEFRISTSKPFLRNIFTNIDIFEKKNRLFVLSDLDNIIESIKTCIEYHGFKFEIKYIDEKNLYSSFDNYSKRRRVVRGIKIFYENETY